MTERPVEHPRDAAVAIVCTLRDAGYTAYLAGGCVRDELLGLEPKDFDVATDARPDAISDLFARTSRVGASFGVVLVRRGGIATEVATFREDGPYSDRRRPDDVRFSTPEADAARRDFTINALFLDPLEADPDRRVIDHVGGVGDIGSRTVRAVGDADARLREDDLRALRAVRFAARLGFTIDPGTADAIRQHAGDLEGVSRERVGDELRRMLTHPTRGRAFGLLGELGLHPHTFGLAGVNGSGDVMAGLPEPAGFAAALAAAAIDLGLDPSDQAGRGRLVADWRRRLALSNDERTSLAETIRAVATLIRGWDRLGVAGQKRLVHSACFGDALAVLEAWRPEVALTVRGRIGELRGIGPGLWAEPCIDGDDLIAAGLAPGPRFGRVLDGVFDAQLEGRVTDREDALRLARELFGGRSV